MTIYLHSFHHSFASNGIKVTYELIRQLNNLGFAAKNLCFDPHVPNAIFPEEYLKNTIFCTETSFPKLNDDDIAIYPEHVQGNPLNAKKIVRYLLNKPYFLFGYGIDYTDTDYVLVFSKLIGKNLPILYILLDERDLFTKIRESTKRKEDTVSIYFGKCDYDLLKINRKILKNIRKQYKNVHIITRQNPSREQTLKMIAESDLMISFDPLSNLNYESTLLGTPVFLVDDFYDTKDIELPAPQKGIFYEFNESNFKVAKREVAESFMYYSDYIQKQSLMIKAAFEKILKHFNDLSNSIYYENNKKRNLLLKEQDLLAFKNRKQKIYSSINFYNDIPLFVQKIFFSKRIFYKNKLKKILRKIHMYDFVKKIYHS